MDGPREGHAPGFRRISTRMTHVGIIVTAVEPEMRFTRMCLGFHETCAAGAVSPGTELSWVNLKVPDGEDYS